MSSKSSLIQAAAGVLSQALSTTPPPLKPSDLNNAWPFSASQTRLHYYYDFSKTICNSLQVLDGSSNVFKSTALDFDAIMKEHRLIIIISMHNYVHKCREQSCPMERVYLSVLYTEFPTKL